MLLFFFGLAFFVFVQAQEEPPPKICGDGIVQVPNDNGQNEKCDDGDEFDQLLGPVEWRYNFIFF